MGTHLFGSPCIYRVGRFICTLFVFWVQTYTTEVLTFNGLQTVIHALVVWTCNQNHYLLISFFWVDAVLRRCARNAVLQTIRLTYFYAMIATSLIIHTAWNLHCSMFLKVAGNASGEIPFRSVSLLHVIPLRTLYQVVTLAQSCLQRLNSKVSLNSVVILLVFW